MSNSDIAIQAAIDCLKDLGINRETIHDRIADWIAKAGCTGAWRDLPPEQKARLGQAMQKYFEAEFTRQGNPPNQLKIGA